MGLRLVLVLGLAGMMVAEMHEYRVGGIVRLAEDDMDSSCFQIRYRSNYKPMTISLASFGDIEQYSISELASTGCKACTDDAKYCVRSSNQEGSHVLAICNEWMYVSLSPKKMKFNAPMQLYVNITTNYNQGWACEGIERDSRNYCMLMSPEECIANCDHGCALLHCMSSKAALANELFSMCVPTSTPDEEKQRRCSVYISAKTFATESCRTKDAGGISASWVIFMALAIPTTIFFLGNIAYYRYSYAKRGRPPFDVPVWCPQALYPRREIEGLQRFSTG